MTIEELLQLTIDRKASDLHLIYGVPPMVRVNGSLFPLPGYKTLEENDLENLIFSLTNDEQKETLTVNRELDFSYPFKDKARFRINAYYQKGTLAASLRLLSSYIPTVEELGLPSIVHEFSSLKQGFILMTGPTGHGKSTTLATIINEISQTRPVHIVTIEDPVEYVFDSSQAIISQRELRADTHSWQIALRSCLREDPDVVMIGEMRDYETIAAALTIAETGHLVFATLHTNSASQTVDRIVDVFPEHQQAQVRLQFSNTIEAILSQRLIPCLPDGRVPAMEILLTTPAVRTSIREGKSYLLDNIIQTSGELGMMTLEMDLARLVKQGKITQDIAQTFSLRPEELMRLLRKK